jgi:DNA invertase Pin-like site-specific DNA recombinase
MRKYCEDKGYEISAELRDKGISGGMDRPVLWDAVYLLGRGDILLCWRLDRISRDVYMMFTIQRSVKSRGAKIESVSGEGTVGETNEDWLIMTMLTTLSEYERRVIRYRTSQALLHYQRNGINVSGKNPPFGYSVDPSNPKRLVRNEKEQTVLRLIMRRREKGYSYEAIANWLRLNKIGNRGQGRWHKDRIWKLVKSQERENAYKENYTSE